MKMSHLVMGSLAAALVAATPSLASAQSWTDWTTGSAGSFGGTLFGSSVTFTGGNIGGQLDNGTNVTGTLTENGNGNNYFSFNSGNAYNQGGLTVPGLGLVQFNGASASNTITFGTAVVNPFLAFVSVGQGGDPVTYDFGSNVFTMLSDNTSGGNCAYWGCGTNSVGVGNSASILMGTEFSGTVQFIGTFSSISFTTDPGENWHAFTVGAAAPASVTPEPATMAMMATGLVAMAGAGIRRRKRSA
jgi:PEP-CTERM motif-containing protein